MVVFVLEIDVFFCGIEYVVLGVVGYYVCVGLGDVVGKIYMIVFVVCNVDVFIDYKFLFFLGYLLLFYGCEVEGNVVVKDVIGDCWRNIVFNEVVGFFCVVEFVEGFKEVWSSMGYEYVYVFKDVDGFFEVEYGFFFFFLFLELNGLIVELLGYVGGGRFFVVKEVNGYQFGVIYRI